MNFDETGPCGGEMIIFLIFHEYIKDTQQVINADIWKIWKGRKYIQANLFVRDGFASNDENDSRPQFLIGC